MAKRYKLIDLKLRIDRTKEGHFWDGEKFSATALPVSICDLVLVPRDPAYFISTEEMKEIPFCQKCLSMLVK